MVSAEMEERLASVLRVAVLQRGRALVSAEMEDSTQARCYPILLQRGRALVSAEIRLAAEEYRRRPSFNGAALW